MARHERTMPITTRMTVTPTEPEEAEGPYQDHFFLILCENLAASAMVLDGTGNKG